MRTTKHREDGRDWDETEESSQDSIALTQTAKGAYQLDMKVYHDADGWQEAVEQMKAIRAAVAKEFVLTDSPSLAVKPKGETA